uniref:Uncharacterized protein n=1 Tax=Populus alba TaxID=43335 RepID=A0A4U5Q6X2_POPAL|nr:hypothetical protein D5086_0000127430 [Populus alba]
MGIMSCHQTSYSDYDSQSHSDHLQANLPTLCSQPSLPSVPSLTSKSHHRHQEIPPTTHHHCLTTLKGHSSYVSSLTLAGKFLYSGSDKEIRLWKRNPLDSEIDQENLSNNVVAVGNGAVKSLSLLPRNQVQIRRHKTCTWVHHVDTVSALALSSDESHLYSVSWDRTIKIWRTNDFKCLESVANAHDDAINAVALSNDGNVYTGSADKKIKIKPLEFGEVLIEVYSCLAVLEGHGGPVKCLTASIDRSSSDASFLLYSGSLDCDIKVWQINVPLL